MAYQANLDAYDWNNDIGEMAAAAAHGLQVSQHSYGYTAGWAWGSWSGNNAWHWFGNPDISQREDYGFGFYDLRAQAWDRIAHSAPNYVIVKVAGNDRGQGPASGAGHYVWNNGWEWSTAVRDLDGGANGFDCIPWNGVAKNILTVGAVTSSGVMSDFSSWGPTDDGRVKPDIVAKGVSVYSCGSASNNNYSNKSGTSTSGPMISGSIGLLLQHQENLHPGVSLLSSTIRALIIHSANDMISGEPGPDYRFGWGLMDTEKCAEIMSMNQDSGGNNIRELTLYDDFEITIDVIPSGTGPMRVTIAWTDEAGVPPIPSLNPVDLMLVNDLDLRVTHSGGQHFPYILNPYDPPAAAGTGDNFRDNVEMIHINMPPTDEIYKIEISHKGILRGGSQQFSLIVTGNTYLGKPIVNPATVRATVPDKPDNVIHNGNTTIRQEPGDFINRFTAREPEEQAKLFRIFPNPTTGIIYLEMEEPGVCSVTVFNLMGEKIFEEEFSGVLRHQFNLSAYPAGIYLIRVIIDDKIAAKKIVLQ
jgi:hypothetical protein